MQPPRPTLCVDGVVINPKGEVLLTKRNIDPFKGCWHLPGGLVNFGERVEDAVIRVVKNETGITAELLSLINVYSDPHRDPRGHFVTIAFLMNPQSGKLTTDFQATDIKYFKKLPQKTGFDAQQIAADGLKIWQALRS